MLKAETVAVALIAINEEEFYIVGHTSDIQRLENAELVERAWDIRLDNGHRPYPVLKKRVNYDITEQPNDEPKNALTREIMRKTDLYFAHNLHQLEKTYLFRETAAFWGDLWVDFTDADVMPADRRSEDYYASYRGCIIPHISSVKFIRL
jgi:hypothetical protein